MAVALRPAVLLIALASILFLVAGALDTYHGISDIASVESYALGAVNLLVAVLIARGSERTLALRIGLAAFFVVERPVSAVAFGAQPLDVVAVHLVTALIELVILISTLRLWRLGHSVGAAELTLLSASAALVGPAPISPVERADPVAAVPATPATEGPAKTAQAPAAGGSGGGWAIGLLALLLAATLVGDAVANGAVPGAAVDLASTEALGYVFALVVLVVAARAVHGRRVPLRLLVAVSLITFVERAFTPFVLGTDDALPLGLHVGAAVLALVLAFASAGALRRSGAPAEAPAT